VTGRVRRGRISVGTCSSRSDLCWAVFGEVDFVSGQYDEVFLLSRRVRRVVVNVVTCSAMSSYYRDFSGKVRLVLVGVRPGRISVGTYS